MSRRIVRPVALGLFRLVMRAIPRRHRFSAVVAMARLPAPLLHWSTLAQGFSRCVLETPQEFAAARLTWMLNRAGIRYTPRVAVRGIEELERALARGRGVLLPGPHTHLTALAVRHLHEAGYPVTAVAGSHYVPPSWRSGEVPRIAPSPHILVEVREALAAGKLVFAMIDSTAPVPGKSVPVETAGGTLHVTYGLLRAARMCGAATVFIASRLAEGGVVCTLAAPRPEESDDGGLREFSRFVQEYALQR